MTVVSIIGLGAIGAAHAARIADSSPATQVRVVAAGARAERLRTDGVVVNGTRHLFPVVEPGDPVDPADLVIVAVKHHHLAEAIGQLAGHVGPGTVLLSLLNGITSEEELAAAYPQASVPLAVSVGIDAVRDADGVRFTSLGRVEFGDAVAGEPSTGVRRLEELLTECAIPYIVRPDMIHTLWWKFLINTGVNQVSALLEAPYRVFQAEGPARDLMISAQREVVAVAQASGVDLTAADIDEFLDVLAKLGPGNYTSMAQDALAHRRTEVDQFAGTIVALGDRYGVETPVNRVLLEAFLAKHQLWGVA
ncbi:ketopantoate reductase family protein [Propionicicella superfundia]|uniref:ketopantoate reductase family protein n=1 Tax=Propionicicella superfundia TaxID=348582 RepID=UPI00055EE37F|nr:ketopantoate reductase family protein [Propionicicella superfundia]